MTTGSPNQLAVLAAMALALTACNSGNGARVTSEQPQAMAPRSEPIFYNGRTYRLDFSPRGAGVYDMAVKGMGPGQQKDAVAVATSSLRYFACRDGQKSRLRAEPDYAGDTWRMQASCV